MLSCKNCGAQMSGTDLICKKCGNIIEVKEDLLDDIEEQIERIYKFGIVDHDVKFYGLCEYCK